MAQISQLMLIDRYFLSFLFGVLAGLLEEGLPIGCFVFLMFCFTSPFGLVGIGFEFCFPAGTETLLSLTLLFAPAFSEAGFQSFWACFPVDFLTLSAFGLLVFGLSLF